MRTQKTQGSFITLIRTFLAKAKEVSDVASNASTDGAPVHPRADVVANLLVLRALSSKIQERLAEDDRGGERVFRYNSSPPSKPSYASSSSSEVSG